MKYIKSYERELDALFDRRTQWLRRAIGKKYLGKPPEINRVIIENSIDKLKHYATKAVVNRLAEDEFKEHTLSRKTWNVKGYGVDGRKSCFDKWFKNKCNAAHPCVYVFWGDKECVYVGKTGKGGDRPQSHFNKVEFQSMKKIIIYTVKSKSQISKLECLAIHRFEPKVNRIKASKWKYSKACPLCNIHREIEEEVKTIFRLR